MAEVLTPMRRQILEFIVTCQRERSFPPTIREIGEHVGLSSSATVANHITVLKNAGYIEKNPQQPRTLPQHRDQLRWARIPRQLRQVGGTRLEHLRMSGIE